MTKELLGLEHHDHSCTDFFKLGHKHMMLLISHSWGARYYLGKWKDNKFTPEFHTKRIFIDRTLVEVFINERQAVVQSQLHTLEDVGICLYSRGGDITADVKGWKIAAANQW